MKGFKLLLNDWKHIFKHKMARRAVGLLLIMPLVYAGLFVSGYWDPYGKLNQFPIAVVNLDNGAKMDSKNINIGKDMVEDLKENKDLDFHFVSKENADKGLKNGNYFLIISIPKDFSQKVTTISDSNPQKANLEYKINQGNNFVAGQISTQVAKEIYDKVNTEITKSYTETMFSNLKDLGNGYVKASDGASKIYDGTNKAKQGAANLKDGASKLADGEKELSKGTVQLTNGVEQLNNGLNSLKSGSDSLTTGLGKLNSSGQQLDTGASNLVLGVSQLKTAVDAQTNLLAQLIKTKKDLTNQLDAYKKANSSAKDDQYIKSIENEIQTISLLINKMESVQSLQSTGISQIKTGQERLASGLHLFNEKLSSVYNGSQKISSGLNQLSLGMNKFSEGFHTFSNGVNSASNGSEKLLNGSESLVIGMNDLTNGSGKLSSSLGQAANKTSTIQLNNSKFDMFAKPVTLHETIMNKVQNYGTSMVPYFLTLGLFVGGLIAANVVPFIREVNNPEITGFQHFINKFSFYSSIAVIQTIIVDLIMLYGFNVHVETIPKFMVLSLIASLTYSSCILMLVSIFGPIGKLFAIIILVIQLVTCGGTFPIDLAPHFIQIINKFLPMTYAVKGFRSVVSTGNWSNYWYGVEVLFLFTMSFAMISCLIIVKANQKGNLIPSEQK